MIAISQFEQRKKEGIFFKWLTFANQSGAANKVAKRLILLKRFRAWHAVAIDKHCEKGLLRRLADLRRFKGPVPFPHSNPSLTLNSNFKNTDLFKLWRTFTRLRSVIRSTQKDSLLERFSIWNQKTAQLIWVEKTADFHNKIRVCRPCFEMMIKRASVFTEAETYIASNAKLKVCHQVFGKWQIAIKNRRLKRSYFHTLKQKRSLLASASYNAHILYSSTTKIQLFNIWKATFIRLQNLDHKSSVMTETFQFVRLKWFLENWKRQTVIQVSKELQTIEWKNLQYKSDCFTIWLKRSIDAHNSKVIARRIALEFSMDCWKKALLNRQEASYLIWSTFSKWKRLGGEIEALRNFAGSRLLSLNTKPDTLCPTIVLDRMKKIKSLQDCKKIACKRKAFSKWNRSESKSRLLSKKLKEFQLKKKKVVFRIIRLVYAFHERSEKYSLAHCVDSS